MITELFPPRIERESRGESFAGKPQFVLKPEMEDAFRITSRPESCLAEGGKTGLLYARDLLTDDHYEPFQRHVYVFEVQ